MPWDGSLVASQLQCLIHFTHLALGFFLLMPHRLKRSEANCEGSGVGECHARVLLFVDFPKNYPHVAAGGVAKCFHLQIKPVAISFEFLNDFPRGGDVGGKPRKIVHIDYGAREIVAEIH